MKPQYNELPQGEAWVGTDILRDVVVICTADLDRARWGHRRRMFVLGSALGHDVAALHPWALGGRHVGAGLARQAPALDEAVGQAAEVAVALGVVVGHGCGRCGVRIDVRRGILQRRVAVNTSKGVANAVVQAFLQRISLRHHHEGYMRK